MNDLATHALVHYVRVIAADLKSSLGYFFTKGVTSYQIMATFWEAVAILELTCTFQVIATVSDGASPNRKFYRVHEQMIYTDDGSAMYCAINLYSPGLYIWFFANPPHFIKPTRNCIAHSGMSIYLFKKSNKVTAK